MGRCREKKQTSKLINKSKSKEKIISIFIWPCLVLYECYMEQYGWEAEWFYHHISDDYCTSLESLKTEHITATQQKKKNLQHYKQSLTKVQSTLIHFSTGARARVMYECVKQGQSLQTRKDGEWEREKEREGRKEPAITAKQEYCNKGAHRHDSPQTNFPLKIHNCSCFCTSS